MTERESEQGQTNKRIDLPEGVYDIQGGEVPPSMIRSQQEQAREALGDVQERMRALREELSGKREGRQKEL